MPRNAVKAAFENQIVSIPLSIITPQKVVGTLAKGTVMAAIEDRAWCGARGTRWCVHARTGSSARAASYSTSRSEISSSSKYFTSRSRKSASPTIVS